VSSDRYIKDIKLTGNPIFGTCNVTLTNDAGRQLLNINLNLQKELKLKIMVNYNLHSI
jgi:hypothetical protein